MRFVDASNQENSIFSACCGQLVEERPTFYSLFVKFLKCALICAIFGVWAANNADPRVLYTVYVWYTSKDVNGTLRRECDIFRPFLIFFFFRIFQSGRETASTVYRVGAIENAQ